MSNLDPITAATHAWAAEKVGTTPGNVKSVAFATIRGGCHTCEYTTSGIEVALHRGGYKEYELAYGESVVDVIREITALVKS